MAGSVTIAFIFGLYSDGDLWTWASGLNDAPRALVAALLLSWPMLGVTALLSLPSFVLVAMVATVATAGIDTIARALARGMAPTGGRRCASAP